MSFMTKTYSKAVGFTAISDDELYYINGGYDTNPSSSWNSTPSYGSKNGYDFGIVIGEIELGVAEAQCAYSIKDGTYTITLEAGAGTRLYTSLTLDAGTSVEAALSIMKNMVKEANSSANQDKTPDISQNQGDNKKSDSNLSYASCGL